jgi:hypothetical protein
MRRRAVVAFLLFILTALPTLAHHSFTAEFDPKSPVSLRGTVTMMEWVNPHVWIHVDVKGADGRVETWKIEGATPNTLIRRGFTKKSLMPGTIIQISGYRAKNGSREANGRDLTFSDGRKVFMGSSGTGAPYDKPSK